MVVKKQCIFQFQSRIRGNSEWAPPRAQIIFHTHKPPRYVSYILNSLECYLFVRRASHLGLYDMGFITTNLVLHAWLALPSNIQHKLKE